MNKGCIVALVVAAVLLALVVLLALPIIRSYNTLVKMREDVNTSWAQVQNVLQRRYDLIPNLVETVRGYAAHEREVLTEVTRARASVGSAQTPDEAIKANNDLSNALARLLVVVEQYPNLKANENFIRLQDELAGTENRIAVERRKYNDTVRIYNQKIQSFPTVLIAGMLGFEKRNYFEAPSAAQEAPKVDFGKPSGN